MAKAKISVAIIIGLTVIVILYVLTTKINKGFSLMHQSLASDLPPTHSILREDSNIISKRYWNKMRADIVYHRKDRNPISLLNFDNKYLLIIYRMDLDKNLLLKNLIHSELRSAYEESGLAYKVINHNDFLRIQYQIQSQMLITNIYLSFSGDSLATLKENDSSIVYHLICNNISIRYNEKEPADIIVVGDERAFGKMVQIPMFLSLLKRGSSVFLLIMTPNK